jgi:DNA-binding IclR family transcriptional regulator
MTGAAIPDDVQRFVLLAIPSVPYLEALLLLRAAPAQDWDAAQLARRLYVPDRTGAELLQLLRDSGIARQAGDEHTLRYAPTVELAALLDRVAQAYATELVAVTGLIHSRIDRRAQRFADAFRFRKD